MRKPVFIVGAVLAAGWSRRMGRPKALLRCGPAGETFVERTVRTLTEGGIDQILVIGRPEDTDLRRVVTSIEPSPRFVENPHAHLGQLSSMLAAVDHAQSRNAEGLLVLPVDMPLVTSETIAAAIDAFVRSDAPIVRVTHGGRHGHPVIFAARVFGDLRAADISIGAKAVVRTHAELVCNLEVDDPGVLRDVDLAADYRALFGREPE